MNIQLSQLNINFKKEELSPFFQVNNKYRVRFDIENINRSNLTQIMDILFNNTDCINVSYLFGTTFPYIIKEPSRIGKYISINSWKEQLFEVENEYDGKDIYKIVTIKNVKKAEVINYILYLKKALKNPYMCIYNDYHLLSNSMDVIDIVSSSTDMINNLTTRYSPIVYHFYDNE
ncbi:hypothetical protein VQ049_03280 [Staphylococcus arlettae]|uniref:hypothetical protein n=1 Tax=Staphylococcus arlettae TaxID=29378 RepID=UPI003CEB3679